VLDATCVPADIAYPTDLRLLNHAREQLEELIDRIYGHLEGFVSKPSAKHDKTEPPARPQRATRCADREPGGTNSRKIKSLLKYGIYLQEGFPCQAFSPLSGLFTVG